MKFTAEAQLKKALTNINSSTLSITAQNKKYIGSRSNIRQVFIDKVVDWTVIASRYRALIGDMEEITSITSSIQGSEDLYPADEVGVAVAHGQVGDLIENQVDVEKS